MLLLSFLFSSCDDTKAFETFIRIKTRNWQRDVGNNHKKKQQSILSLSQWNGTVVHGIGTSRSKIGLNMGEDSIRFESKSIASRTHIHRHERVEKNPNTKSDFPVAHRTVHSTV